MTQPGDEMTQLKPCPFCGQTDYLSQTQKEGQHCARVWCSHCTMEWISLGNWNNAFCWKLLEVECQKLNNALDSERAKSLGLYEAAKKAYRELNEIRARDGVPRTYDGFKSSVDPEYFSSVVDELQTVIEAYRPSRPEAGTTGEK